MASEVEICNSALIKVGAERIDSLSDNNKRARAVAFQYPLTRRKLLRGHPWNFAIKRELLNPSPTKPKYGFKQQFALPADCLRVFKVENRSVEIFYKVEGRFILCDESSLQLKYITDETDVSKFDSLFYDILSLMLASDISFSLVQDKNLTNLLASQLEHELAKVRSTNSQEDIPDALNPDYFIGARSGVFFDPNKAG